MKTKHLFARLESLGFRITTNDGSKKKIYPPDKTKPFYSYHSDNKENAAAMFALSRFARKNWGIDINSL
jgi:hypothetical protein